MNPIDSKLKKILAMIDGATSEGEARAASLALQRLLAANNKTATASAKATVSQPAPNERHGQGRATLAPAHSILFFCDCNRSIARI